MYFQLLSNTSKKFSKEACSVALQSYNLEKNCDLECVPCKLRQILVGIIVGWKYWLG